MKSQDLLDKINRVKKLKLTLVERVNQCMHYWLKVG